MLYYTTIVQKPSIHDRLRTSRNTHHITAREVPATAITRSDKEVPLDRGAKHKIARHRGLLQALENVDLSPLDSTVASWEELQARSIDVFELHAQRNANILDEAQVESILHAGTAGAGASGAFLRVIPELVSSDMTLTIANNSLRTAMEWAALSEKADAGLTRTIAKVLPSSKLSVRDQYIGLTYDPSFFIVNETPVPYITIDYTKLEAYASDIDKGLGGRDVYFGCPFRKNIPRVYRAMATTAVKSELL